MSYAFINKEKIVVSTMENGPADPKWLSENNLIAIKVDKDKLPKIGDTWDGKNFIHAVQPIPITPPDPDPTTPTHTTPTHNTPTPDPEPGMIYGGEIEKLREEKRRRIRSNAHQAHNIGMYFSSADGMLHIHDRSYKRLQADAYDAYMFGYSAYITKFDENGKSFRKLLDPYFTASLCQNLGIIRDRIDQRYQTRLDQLYYATTEEEINNIKDSISPLVLVKDVHK